MKLITKQYLASIAAKRWKDSYENGPYWQTGHRATWEKLVALGSNPSPDDVDKEVGNTSWTDRGMCHECKAKGVDLVEVGEEPDYESSTCRLCADCVFKVMKLIDGE